MIVGEILWGKGPAFRDGLSVAPTHKIGNFSNPDNFMQEIYNYEFVERSYAMCHALIFVLCGFLVGLTGAAYMTIDGYLARVSL